MKTYRELKGAGFWGASGGAVALQVGRSRIRFQIQSLEFFIDIILPAALWPLGLTQPLTEMSIRNMSCGLKSAGA